MIIITVIIIVNIVSKGNRVKLPMVNTQTIDGNAVSPDMYNQSLDKLAKDYIKDELKEHGFSIFDSTLDLEVKKTLLVLIPLEQVEVKKMSYLHLR